MSKRFESPLRDTIQQQSGVCQDISCLETKQICTRFLEKKNMEVKPNEPLKKRGGFSQTQHTRSSCRLLDDIDLTA